MRTVLPTQATPVERQRRCSPKGLPVPRYPGHPACAPASVVVNCLLIMHEARSPHLSIFCDIMYVCVMYVCKYRNYSIGGITEDSQGGRVGKREGEKVRSQGSRVRAKRELDADAVHKPAQVLTLTSCFPSLTSTGNELH